MITSTSNAQIKNIRQLLEKTKARRQYGLFVAEGIKMFLEAPEQRIEQVYISESLAGSLFPGTGKPSRPHAGTMQEKPLPDQWAAGIRSGSRAAENDTVAGRTEQTAQGSSLAALHAELAARLAACPCETVSDAVFADLSSTATPQGILTVVKKPVYTPENFFAAEELSGTYLLLEDLQDPGNLGTIFRTGEGAGVRGILLTRTCVDVTNPKVVRATMGSVYRVPFLEVEDTARAAALLHSHGVRIFAAHLRGKNSYDRENYRQRAAFMIGNEAKGLTEEAAALADTLIRIPMAGRLESLNAAMAAGILLYEAARQNDFQFST